MLILAYGYKLPQSTDTGDDIFAALEDDINQLATHNHNGTNSAPLGVTTQTIAAGSWGAAPIGGGLFRQLITLPGALVYDSLDMWFRTSTGVLLYPSIERVSTNTYYIYCNDNTLTLTAFYR